MRRICSRRSGAGMRASLEEIVAAITGGNQGCTCTGTAARNGFLMMDDPLVDIDPVRQKAAAGAIAAFTAGRQLILFTCHPAITELFSGNLIRLLEERRS